MDCKIEMRNEKGNSTQPCKRNALDRYLRLRQNRRRSCICCPMTGPAEASKI